MKLAAREIGSGPPLVVLHGLFGSGENWHSAAKLLAERYRVVMMDLPNHGDSPHTDRFTYEDAAGAVSETMSALDIAQAALLGHSMGGKVAMRLSLTEPEKVSSLVVVDIAPKRYPPLHRGIIDGLNHVAARAPESRRDADEALSAYVPEKPVRAFLLKSFARADDGSYRWRINIPVLDRDYENVAGWPETTGEFDGPALFISGADSDYVTPEDHAAIHALFPHALFEELPNAGHWMHAEQPEAFTHRVLGFLSRQHESERAR